METIAFRATWRHAVLEHQIREMDPNQDLSRSAITNRAIAMAKDVKDWRAVKAKLASLKRLDIPVAISMQARPDEQRASEIPAIKRRILSDLEGEIERLQTPYFVQLIWMNYLETLKEKAWHVGSDKNLKKDISAPDMVKLLVEIILLNREEDAATIAKIKEVLIEWRSRR